ncbi:DUF6518 family protein [Streptomyces sp. NPDC058486]|uniref:DUF6518 family protein n=1 Tax=unclassified Streptomyces TaxID=2593676 RepID=UPI00365A461C
MSTTPGTLAPPETAVAPRSWGVSVAMATGAGLALGVLTNLAQGWLPYPWGQIANSGAVWSCVAFAAGAVLFRRAAPRQAALGGLGAEVALVIGYYGYAEWGRDGMGSLVFPLLWLGLACVAGPLFGVAGHWLGRPRDTWRRVVGIAALAGVFGMEAIQYAWVLHYAPQAWTCLAILLLVPLLLGRSPRERLLALAAAVPSGLLAYVIIHLPVDALSG